MLFEFCKIELHIDQSFGVITIKINILDIDVIFEVYNIFQSLIMEQYAFLCTLHIFRIMYLLRY